MEIMEPTGGLPRRPSRYSTFLVEEIKRTDRDNELMRARLDVENTPSRTPDPRVWPPAGAYPPPPSSPSSVLPRSPQSVSGSVAFPGDVPLPKPLVPPVQQQHPPLRYRAPSTPAAAGGASVSSVQDRTLDTTRPQGGPGSSVGGSPASPPLWAPTAATRTAASAQRHPPAAPAPYSPAPCSTRSRSEAGHNPAGGYGGGGISVYSTPKGSAAYDGGVVRSRSRTRQRSSYSVASERDTPRHAPPPLPYESDAPSLASMAYPRERMRDPGDFRMRSNGEPRGRWGSDATHVPRGGGGGAAPASVHSTSATTTAAAASAAPPTSAASPSLGTLEQRMARYRAREDGHGTHSTSGSRGTGGMSAERFTTTTTTTTTAGTPLHTQKVAAGAAGGGYASYGPAAGQPQSTATRYTRQGTSSTLGSGGGGYRRYDRRDSAATHDRDAPANAYTRCMSGSSTSTWRSRSQRVGHDDAGAGTSAASRPHDIPLLPLDKRMGSLSRTSSTHGSRNPPEGNGSSIGDIRRVSSQRVAPSSTAWRSRYQRGVSDTGTIASSVAQRYTNDLKFIKLHAKNLTVSPTPLASGERLPAVASTSQNFNIQTTLYQCLVAMAPELHLSLPADPFRFTDRELLVTRGRDTFAIANNKSRTLRELGIRDEDVISIKRGSVITGSDGRAVSTASSAGGARPARGEGGADGKAGYVTLHVRSEHGDTPVAHSFSTLTTLRDLYAAVGGDVDVFEAAGELSRLEVLHRMCVWDVARDGGCSLSELKIAGGDTIELRVAEPTEGPRRDATPSPQPVTPERDDAAVTIYNAMADRSAPQVLPLTTKLVHVVLEGFELDPRRSYCPLHEIEVQREAHGGASVGGSDVDAAWDAARYRNFTLRELSVRDGDTLVIREHRSRRRANGVSDHGAGGSVQSHPQRPRCVPALNLHADTCASEAGGRVCDGGAAGGSGAREVLSSPESTLAATQHMEPATMATVNALERERERERVSAPSKQSTAHSLSRASSRPREEEAVSSVPEIIEPLRHNSSQSYGRMISVSPQGSPTHMDPGDTTDTTSRHSRTDAQPSAWFGEGGLILRGSARVGGMLEVELEGHDDILKLGTVAWYSVTQAGHRVFTDSNVPTYVVSEQDFDSYIQVEFAASPSGDVFAVTSPVICYLPSIENAEIQGSLVAGQTIEVSYDVSGGDCTVDIDWEGASPTSPRKLVGRGHTLYVDPALENCTIRCNITPILLRGGVRGTTTTIEHPDVVRGDRPVVRGLELTTQEVELLPGAVVEPWADLDYTTTSSLAAPLITWTIDCHTYEGRTYTIKPNDLGKRLDCTYRACTADGKESEVATAALLIPWVPLASVSLKVETPDAGDDTAAEEGAHRPSVLCAVGWELRCVIEGVQNAGGGGGSTTASAAGSGPKDAAAAARKRQSTSGDTGAGGSSVEKNRQDTVDDDDILNATSPLYNNSFMQVSADRFFTWSKSLDGLSWTVVQASSADCYTPTPDTVGHLIKCVVTGVYHQPAFSFVSVPPQLTRDFVALVTDSGIKGFNVLHTLDDDPSQHRKHLILTTKYLKLVSASDKTTVLKSKWSSNLRLTCSPTDRTSFTLTTDPATPPMELAVKAAAERDALAVLFRCFHAIGMPAMCMEIFSEKVRSSDDKRSLATWEAVQTPYEVTVAKIIADLKADAHHNVMPLPPPARAILNTHHEKGDGWLQAWLAIASVARCLAATRA